MSYTYRDLEKSEGYYNQCIQTYENYEIADKEFELISIKIQIAKVYFDQNKYDEIDLNKLEKEANDLPPSERSYKLIRHIRELMETRAEFISQDNQKKSNSVNVTIAIAGYGNTGKTSLIRTLVKDKFGDVKDISGSTNNLESITYKSTNLQFTDCPGITSIDLYEHYLKELKKEIKKSKKEIIEENNWELGKIDLHITAFQGIERADLVVYVASMETTPNEVSQREINAIKRKGKKIICIVNQFYSVSPEKQNREDTWKKFCKDQNIECIILDSFWDSPSKVDLLYSSILQCLSNKPDKLSSFELASQTRIDDQVKRLQKICNEFAKCLIDCRKIKITTSNTEEEKEKSQKECSQIVLSIVTKFIESTQKIFDIDVNIKNEDIQKIILEDDYVVTYISDNAGDSVGKTALFSGIGAVIGSVVPFVGTGIGAGIGAGIGYLSSRNIKIEINLSLKNLQYISCFCLAYLSACSFCGYARYGLKIEKEERKQLDFSRIDIFIEETRKYCTKKNDLATLTESEIVEWFKNFLNKL